MEAETNAFLVWANKKTLPGDLSRIFQEVESKNMKTCSFFWVLVKTLKAFWLLGQKLPLTGTLPDLTSHTADY